MGFEKENVCAYGTNVFFFIGGYGQIFSYKKDIFYWGNGIVGTGHAIIQISNKDEWYIVYHPLNFPNGKEMGWAADYNREVSIDKLEFRSDGTIIPSIPTIQGIKPIKIR